MAENTDVKLCLDALAAKKNERAKRWNYYDGEHPLVYASDKLNQVFRQQVVFVQNWCEVIVNATLDRLKFRAFDCGTNNVAKETLEKMWRNTLRKQAQNVHKAVAVTGEGYVIAWPDKETSKPQAFYHDPRTAHVLYEDDDPTKKRVGCKLWVRKNEQGKNFRFLNLYYTDRIEHYVGTSTSTNGITIGGEGASKFKLIGNGVEMHQHNIIPVFHFRRDDRAVVGELA